MEMLTWQCWYRNHGDYKSDYDLLYSIIEPVHITSLQPIKKKGSYNDLDEYLETYHKLLREECYRNLHAGIRNFIENPRNHDPKQMNMYR